MPFDDQDQIDLDTWEKRVFEKHGVPEGLRHSIRSQESGGDVNATSPTGVKGRYQVTQRTAQGFGLNRDDPWEQPIAAAKLLRQGFDEAKRRNPSFSDRQAWLASSASYYAGPNAFDDAGNISTASKDGLSNPSRYAESVARKWADFEKGQGAQTPVNTASEFDPQGSTLRKAISPGRQQTTVRGPVTPSRPSNPFSVSSPTGFEQAGQQVTARTQNLPTRAPTPEEVEFQRRGPLGRVGYDVKTGLRRAGGAIADQIARAVEAAGGIATGDFRPAIEQAEGAGRGLVKAGALLTDPTGIVSADQTRAIQALQKRQMARRGNDPYWLGSQESARIDDARAAANPTLEGKIVRGVTQGAVGTVPMVAAGAAGGVPAIMGLTAVQQDYTRPEDAALNLASAYFPIKAGHAVSPIAARIGQRFASPLAQEAARRGIEIGAGGLANAGQYAAGQALIGQPFDPEEAIAQGITGGILSGAMAPGRSQVPAMTPRRSGRIEAESRPVTPDQAFPYTEEGRPVVDPNAPIVPELVGRGINRAGDLGATVQRAGDIRPTPRGTKPMPIQNRLEQGRIPTPIMPEGWGAESVQTGHTRPLPPIETIEPSRPPSNPLDINRANANEAKINASQAEESGDWGRARTEYDTAHAALVRMRRQLGKIAGAEDEVSALDREISAADVNRKRAMRQMLVAERAQRIGQGRAQAARSAVENAPTADLPPETSPLLKSVVNPEGGIPSAKESPSGLFGQLVRQQAAEQARPVRGPKDSGQLSAAEYLKRASRGEGIRVSDRGEAQILGAKEAGIVGLTNKRSKYAVSDAQVMLDEGGFNLPDGRKFTDPSVTENDVLTFLSESGREGRMNTRDLDNRIEQESADYYANRPPSEPLRPDSNRLPRIGDLPPSRVSRNLQPEIPRGTDQPMTLAERARQAGGSTEDLAVLDALAKRQGAERPRPYGERTVQGEPGQGGLSLSPYADLVNRNRPAIEQLRGMNLESPEAGEIIARIDDDAARRGIEPHHVENLLNALRGEQVDAAERADSGVGSVPLRRTSTGELQDFYARPDEAPAPSEPLRPVKREPVQVRQEPMARPVPRVESAVERPPSSRRADEIASDLRRLHAMSPEEVDQSLRNAEARRNEDIRNPQMNEVERRMNRDLLQFANERRHELVKAKQLPPKVEKRPGRGEQDLTLMKDDVLAKRIADAEKALDNPRLSEARAQQLEDFLTVAEKERNARAAKARTVSHPDPAINGKPILAETADGRVIISNENNKTGVSVVKSDRAQVKYSIPDEAMPELNPSRERGNQPPPMPDRVTARELAENVRAEYRPAKNRPGTIYVNDWGLEALNAAHSIEFADASGSDRITGGVNYKPERARILAEHIRDRAARPNFSEEGRKNLEAMARQIELAADDGAVSFVPMVGQGIGSAKTTVRHEVFHAQQSSISPKIHELTMPRWLPAQKFGAAIAEHLGKLGYEKHELPAEAAAYVASGDWGRFGMSRDDARQFLADYFDDVAYRHGKDAINKFRAIHPALQDIVEARRGTNEPRFGNAAAGLGRGVEPAVNRQRGGERSGVRIGGGGGGVPGREVGSVRGQSPTQALRAITPESLRAGQSPESPSTESRPRQRGLAGIRAEDLRVAPESVGGSRGSNTRTANREPQTAADYLQSKIDADPWGSSQSDRADTATRVAHKALRDAAEKIRVGKMSEDHQAQIVGAANDLMVAGRLGDQSQVTKAQRALHEAVNSVEDRGALVRGVVKTGRFVKRIPATIQGAVFGGDWSYVARQAGIMTMNPANIVDTFRAFRLAYHASGREVAGGDPTKTGLRGMMSKIGLPGSKGAEHVRQIIASHPRFDLAMKAGLETAAAYGSEEVYHNSYANKALWIKRAEAGNEAAIDWMRLQNFSKFADSIEGNSKYNEAQRVAAYKQAAEIINTFTGRTNVGEGKLKAAVEATSGILSAPRLNISRIQTINPVWWGKQFKENPAVAKMAAKQVAQTATAVGGLMALGAAAGVMRVALDPRDKEFGKVQVGDWRGDFSSGLLPWIKLATTTGDLAYKVGAEAATGTPGAKMRRMKAQDEAVYQAKKRLRSMVGPMAGYMADILVYGKSFEGQPMTARSVVDIHDPNNAALRLATPSYLRSALEAGQQKGSAKAVASVVVPEMLGVNAYIKNPPKKILRRAGP